MLAVARRRLRDEAGLAQAPLLLADARALPFPDAAFDCLLSTYTLGGLRRRRRAPAPPAPPPPPSFRGRGLRSSHHAQGGGGGAGAATWRSSWPSAAVKG